MYPDKIFDKPRYDGMRRETSGKPSTDVGFGVIP